MSLYDGLVDVKVVDVDDIYFEQEIEMETETLFFEGPTEVTITIDAGETLYASIEKEPEMTATEKLLVAAARLRDLVETRAVDGADDEIMEDIADAYDEFLLADEEENVELDEVEEELND